MATIKKPKTDLELVFKTALVIENEANTNAIIAIFCNKLLGKFDKLENQFLHKNTIVPEIKAAKPSIQNRFLVVINLFID